MLLAALVLVLGADKALLEALQSDDSLVRTRAAYALARTHDPSDGTAAAKLDRLLTEGSDEQRAAIARGLLCRDGGVAEARVVKLLDDPSARVRETVIESTRCLSKQKAAAILAREEPLADKRPEGIAAQLRLRIHRVGMELGIEELKGPMRRELHKRTEFLFFKKDCTLETCAEDLAALAWLGEDVSWMKKRLEAQRPANFFETLILLRLDAVGGSASATSTLAESAHNTLDPEVRRKAVEWLRALPPAPRADAMDGLLNFVEDIDLRIRTRVITTFAAAPSRHAAESRAALLTALDDPEPDIRLEAIVGLGDLGVAIPKREDADPVVRAVLNAMK